MHTAETCKTHKLNPVSRQIQNCERIYYSSGNGGHVYLLQLRHFPQCFLSICESPKITPILIQYRPIKMEEFL